MVHLALPMDRMGSIGRRIGLLIGLLGRAVCAGIGSNFPITIIAAVFITLDPREVLLGSAANLVRPWSP
jgi:hypothetical protein